MLKPSAAALHWTAALGFTSTEGLGVDDLPSLRTFKPMHKASPVWHLTLIECSYPVPGKQSSMCRAAPRAGLNLPSVES